jgi:hypothetical protein
MWSDGVNPNDSLDIWIEPEQNAPLACRSLGRVHEPRATAAGEDLEIDRVGSVFKLANRPEQLPTDTGSCNLSESLGRDFDPPGHRDRRISSASSMEIPLRPLRRYRSPSRASRTSRAVTLATRALGASTGWDLALRTAEPARRAISASVPHSCRINQGPRGSRGAWTFPPPRPAGVPQRGAMSGRTPVDGRAVVCRRLAVLALRDVHLDVLDIEVQLPQHPQDTDGARRRKTVELHGLHESSQFGRRFRCGCRRPRAGA